MAIQNTFELEAVMTRVLVKLDQHIAQRGSWPVLETARRTMEQARAVTRQGPKLKAQREPLRSAVETILTELPVEGGLHEDLWDIEDYVDYRA